MKTFDIFFKKEETLTRSYTISDELYSKLLYLSQNIYDASISKLICAALKTFIDTENINLYEVKENDYSSKHTIYIKKSLVDALDNLNAKFRISVSRMINIAIYNALLEEVENLKDYEGYNS